MVRELSSDYGSGKGCPKCGAELVLAECENPETGEKKELMACACGFRGMPTEVYARVCGYLRPEKQWNAGKRAERENRKMYSVE